MVNNEEDSKDTIETLEAGENLVQSQDGQSESTEKSKEATAKTGEDTKEQSDEGKTRAKISKEDLKKEKSLDYEKNMKINIVAQSLIYIIFGLALLIYTQITMEIICYVIAGITIVLGIVFVVSYFVRNVGGAFFRYDLVVGLVCLLIGILMLTKKSQLLDIIPIVMGILLTVNGVVKLQHAIDLKRVDNRMKIYSGSWVFVLIFALVCLVAGIFMVFNPEKIVSGFIKVVGAGYIFAGITDIVTMVILGKKINIYRKSE